MLFRKSLNRIAMTLDMLSLEDLDRVPWCDSRQPEGADGPRRKKNVTCLLALLSRNGLNFSSPSAKTYVMNFMCEYLRSMYLDRKDPGTRTQNLPRPIPASHQPNAPREIGRVVIIHLTRRAICRIWLLAEDWRTAIDILGSMNTKYFKIFSLFWWKIPERIIPSRRRLLCQPVQMFPKSTAAIVAASNRPPITRMSAYFDGGHFASQSELFQRPYWQPAQTDVHDYHSQKGARTHRRRSVTRPQPVLTSSPRGPQDEALWRRPSWTHTIKTGQNNNEPCNCYDMITPASTSQLEEANMCTIHCLPEDIGWLDQCVGKEGVGSGFGCRLGRGARLLESSACSQVAFAQSGWQFALCPIWLNRSELLSNSELLKFLSFPEATLAASARKCLLHNPADNVVLGGRVLPNVAESRFASAAESVGASLKFGASHSLAAIMVSPTYVYKCRPAEDGDRFGGQHLVGSGGVASRHCKRSDLVRPRAHCVIVIFIVDVTSMEAETTMSGPAFPCTIDSDHVLHPHHLSVDIILTDILFKGTNACTLDNPCRFDTRKDTLLCVLSHIVR
ncbi:hypothetical protein PR048_016465 [Dryococelus australis]|uniref:Uncharacterized protein n=1 Tax=Dryococelus australis TaxID=614101 RepID=A0ABQ9HJS6_9NEOP|nr:hypothetical protein PR048_016465 [Dryococelus australis]